jgi:hypothetical protein
VEKYRAHEKPVDVTLPDFGPDWRTIKANVLGELDLRLVLEQLTDRARAVRSASGWGGDRFVLLEKDGRQAFVLRSMWDSPNDARNFFEAFSLGMRNRFTAAREEEATASRQALSTSDWATDVRRVGAEQVVVVIAFDRASSDALIAALLAT